ncbi:MULTISPECIES: hypothetical protein [unclassified Caballeronia]|uniref:hypothetical protein n=1 Tax=unclassified Caballeronia TaxID=2646786 RepID=UPI00158DBBCE|nr:MULTISPECIES: hypothetical protein [unclassified Caballeronia]QSN62383.1 hypothetical protein JYK05_05770 [Caballeronia sp. M1242]
MLRDELCSEAAQADIDAVVRRYLGHDDGDRDAAKHAKAQFDALTMEMDNLSQAIAELGIAPALIERSSARKPNARRYNEVWQTGE